MSASLTTSTQHHRGLPRSRSARSPSMTELLSTATNVLHMVDSHDILTELFSKSMPSSVTRYHSFCVENLTRPNGWHVRSERHSSAVVDHRHFHLRGDLSHDLATLEIHTVSINIWHCHPRPQRHCCEATNVQLYASRVKFRLQCREETAGLCV